MSSERGAGKPSADEPFGRRLGAVTKSLVHLFVFRYGSLCRFGMSPLNLFCYNGLPLERAHSPTDASDGVPIETGEQSLADGTRDRFERPEPLDPPFRGWVCGQV